MTQTLDNLSTANASQRKADEVDFLVGRRLKERRRAMKLSQKELGAALGISYQQVQKYESGTNRISAGRLYNIASLLGLKIEDFFDGADDGNSEERKPLITKTNYPVIGNPKLESVLRELMNELARRQRERG